MSSRFKDIPLDDDDPANRALAASSISIPAPRASLGGTGNFMTRRDEAATKGLQSEIESLRAQINSGKLLVTLDPKTITHSEFANRHELSLSDADPELLKLKQSIQEYGQDRPVFVRPAPSGSAFKFELVEGHRRHAVCLMLDAEVDGGWRINALIDSKINNPKSLVLQMHRENDDRHPLSPYEIGASWAAWLAAGVYRSQAEIAKDVFKGESTVFKYIQVAELPPAVLAAFKDPRTISLRWGTELAAALKAKPAEVEAEAVKLQSNVVLTPEQIFRHLIDCAQEKRPANPSREEAVKIQGKVAFRIATKDGRLSLRYAASIPKATQRELCEEIKELVEKALKSGRIPK
jgi:ParB family chromosome partitioning protein